MSKTIFSLLLIFTFTISFAQTRRIAHRAHSGANTERYAKGEGNYGYYPQTVTVHLESGRDTTVNEWDSLANPRYNFLIDTTPRAQFGPRNFSPKQDIRDMGTVTGKLIASAGPN